MEIILKGTQVPYVASRSQGSKLGHYNLGRYNLISFESWSQDLGETQMP